MLFNFLEIWGRQRPSIFQSKHLHKCIYLPFNHFYLLAYSFKIFRISLGVESCECRGIRDANAKSRHLQTSTLLAHRIQNRSFHTQTYAQVHFIFGCIPWIFVLINQSRKISTSKPSVYIKSLTEIIYCFITLAGLLQIFHLKDSESCSTFKLFFFKQNKTKQLGLFHQIYEK